jgi:hypothetical protein
MRALPNGGQQFFVFIKPQGAGGYAKLLAHFADRECFGLRGKAGIRHFVAINDNL